MAKVIKAGFARFSKEEPKKETVSDKESNQSSDEQGGNRQEVTVEADFQAAYEELIATAQDEVTLMLQDARNEALTLVRAAEKEAEDLRRNAWEEGYREGIGKAVEETEHILIDGQKQIDTLVKKGEQSYKKLMDEVEPQVFRLALEIAHKILGYELDRNDEAFKSMLTTALQSVKADHHVQLRVNSADYARFFKEREITLHTANGNMEASVSIDPIVEPYGLLIDTDSGTIDAGLGAQLEQLTVDT